MRVVILRSQSRWKAVGGMAVLIVAFLLLRQTAVAAAGLDPCLTSADGALCNDGNPCTKSDVCQDGVCTGLQAVDGTVCTDGNLCTLMDQCWAGECVGVAIPEGDPCDDGNKCTVGDRCTGGSCLPVGKLQCDDLNVCTEDRCLPNRGCTYSPTPNLPPMCVPPDGGPGSGGQGGAGGSGGQSGFGGTGGQSSQGGSGGQGASNVDAAVFDGGVDAGSFGGSFFDSGVGGQVVGDVDAGLDAGADAFNPFDPVGYEVQGGAVFCAYSPRSRGDGAGGPCILLLGLTIYIGRRRRSRRR